MTLALFIYICFLFLFEQAFLLDGICTPVDLETAVRFLFCLALLTCLPPRQTAVLPSGIHAAGLPAISESFTFFSHAGWTCTSACKTKSTLPLCSDSSLVSFLTPSPLWSCRRYFAELFWHCWGIMCFWYEEGEHSVNVHFCCSYSLLGVYLKWKK